MSTRQTENGLFDYGCQYFTANDEKFRCSVDGWHKAGVVKVWHGPVVELDSGIVTEIPSNLPRYVGAQGIQAVCDRLAVDLPVQSGVEVKDVTRTDAGWCLMDLNEKVTGPFDAVVVATPPIQAAVLLREVPLLANTARSISMSPCWTVMAAFPRRIEFPADGAVVRNSALSWIARNSVKGERSEDPDCWVLHASAEWSQQHLEDAKQVIEEQLLFAFMDATGCSRQAGTHLTAHRWRYAICMQPLTVGCLLDATLNIAACGDWCLGNNVEAAFLSGIAAAGRVLRLVSGR